MKEQLAMKDTFRFDAPGSLQRPGPVGRLVRLFMGVFLGWIVWRLVFQYDGSDLVQPGTWFWVVFALVLVPYVVNIGFGVTWGAWPRIAGIAVLLAGAAIGYLNDGTVFAQPLWLVTLVLMTYVYAHLAGSFLVSSLLATPGCEMRGLPHLLARLRGSEAEEHYCPGFIDNVDRWESERTLPADQRGNPRVRDDDLLRDGKRMLLFYGLPFAAIQVTGFVGGRTVAAIVWIVGFAVMGLVGIANAIRTRRVHGFFTGPWFLLAAAAVALRYFGLLDISGPVVLNAGLFFGLLLYFISENIWGKYFGKRASGENRQVTSKQPLHIQLLSFPACPSVDAARKVLQDALATVGEGAGFEEINVHDPATPEALRNWASPTILVNGKDVAGGDSHEGTGCRIYDGENNAPDRDLIINALRAVLDG